MGIFEKLEDEIKKLKNRLDKVESEKRALTIAIASLIYKSSVESSSSQSGQSNEKLPPKNDLSKVIHSSQLNQPKKPVLQLSQTSITIPDNVYHGENIKIYVENVESGIVVKFITDIGSN